MEPDIKRLHVLLQEGYCCAAALVQLGLEYRGETNGPLIQAMRGLCLGVHGQLLCGALTGAVCMMNVLAPEHANICMVPELAAWFRETVTSEYGGVNCADVLAGDRLNRTLRCPGLVEATYRQAKAIMEEFGFRMDQNKFSSLPRMTGE